MKRLGIALAVTAGCLLAWTSQPYTFQSSPFPDFDEDGVVGFADFLQFAGKFGAERGDEAFDVRFDLDADGAIGFPDFLIFAGNFGRASPYAGDENDVNIPDASLRAVIADSLGKARDAAINRAELASLTRFEATGANIRQLTGLQFATNLKELWLQDNAITDLSPLCDLIGLTNLVLFGNAISDLSPLSGLINLTGLNLNDNRVSNISPVAALKKLKHLWLLNNRITNVPNLTGLSDLVGLEIGGTGLTELSAIAGLTNLTELGLSNNEISDISAVSGLINLKYLDLSDNCVSDLSALTGLTNLTHLNLHGNRITDFSPLVTSTGINRGDEIDLRDNPSSPESLELHIPALQAKGVDLQFDDELEWVCTPILPDNLSVDAGSSHTLQANKLYADHQRIRPHGRRGGIAAVAYADFNGDGHVDVFFAPSDGWQRDPIPIELYLNDGTGCFTLDTSFLGANPPGRLAPRKALPGDFNGDGRMDVFVLDHGYDKPPFPGAAPYVILSSGDGYVLGSGLQNLVGFQHGGASADIDGDGDIDVFVTHLNRTDGPFFLINDGTGTFSLDEDRVDGLDHKALFTAELVDVDGDGFLDLLAAGHEYELHGNDLPTQILWGDRSGGYSTDRATVLPAVIGHGVVVDIDASDTDGDGDKDIVINRTGDERTSSYGGYYLQLVEQVAARRFEDRTAELLDQNSDDKADWIVWIRMCDCDQDGDVDIAVDDTARKLVWKNDGSGVFRRR